jgi:streptomycin 6-kinase
LLAEPKDAVVLHGDLHHDNAVLAADGRYLAIDPQGLIGDPSYDVACLLRNPIDPADEAFGPVPRLRRRAAILGETLGDPIERILGWTAVGAVVAAAWSASAGEDCRHWLAVADEAHRALGPGAPSRRAASAAGRSIRPS